MTKIIDAALAGIALEELDRIRAMEQTPTDKQPINTGRGATPPGVGSFNAPEDHSE